MNFQMFKLDLEKSEEPDQIANICRIIERARQFQKNLYFCLLTRPKPLTVWTTQIVENSSRDGNIRPPDLPPDTSVCGTGSNWTWNNRLLPTGKEVRQGCILSPCLFNFYAEYIMKNAGPDETEAGIKIACREKYQ